MKKIFFTLIVAVCISQAVGWTSVSATEYTGSLLDLPQTIENIQYGDIITEYLLSIDRTRTFYINPIPAESGVCSGKMYFSSSSIYYGGTVNSYYREYTSSGTSASNVAQTNVIFGLGNYDNAGYLSSTLYTAKYNSSFDIWNSDCSTILLESEITGYSNVSSIGITTTTPEPDATNVNAYTNFTGTYDNDGTYDTVGIEYQRIEDNANVLHFKVCDIAEIGTGLTYSCYASLSTESHYMYQPYLWDSNQDFPEGVVLDSESPYYFTTGLVYEIQTPSVSSACETLDIGCYIRDVFSSIGSYFTSFYTFLQSLFIPNMGNIISSYQDSFSEYSSRIPFSYVFGLRDIISDLSSSTASGLSVSIPFASQNIVLLSSSSLSSNPISPIVKSSLSVVIWLLFAYLVYKRGVSLFS